jgi:DNA-binding transcriptional regulator YiaG
VNVDVVLTYVRTSDKVQSMESTVQQLKKLREWQSLSQEGVARLLGVSVRTVARWENGESSPSPLANQKLKQMIDTRFEGNSDVIRS